jgi:hypothetical protein
MLQSGPGINHYKNRKNGNFVAFQQRFVEIAIGLLVTPRDPVTGGVRVVAIAVRAL